MKQMMECLLTKVRESYVETIAELKATEKMLEAKQRRTKCKMIAWLEGTMTCLEGMEDNQEKFQIMDLEANAEERVTVAKHQEARSEEAAGVLED
jgi:hypothetical protein